MLKLDRSWGIVWLREEDFTMWLALIVSATWRNNTPLPSLHLSGELTKAGSHRMIAESDIDIAIVEAFDKSIYMNPRNFDLPRNFLEALHRHHNESQKSERYAPYVALIQSSGYGKTRLISEIAEKVFVIYLCFREQASTGYPKATPLASELISIMREAEQPTWFDIFITVILVQARKTIANLCPNPKDFWNFQMNQDNAQGFWIEVINQVTCQMYCTPFLKISSYWMLCHES